MKYYIVSIASIVLIASCTDQKPQQATIAAKKEPVHYKTEAVEKKQLSGTVTLPAQLAAYQEVSIFPKVNGYVKEVRVDIGAKVKKGKLLMVLEAPELMQAALQAKERYARTQANFSLDKEQYRRFLEASATAGAISPLDLSSLRARMEADSALNNAERLNWQMQQTMLGYLQVAAPFDGVITERNVHPGALVSASSKEKPMLELKEIDHLRLQVDVPDAIAGSLKNKDSVLFYINSMPGKKMQGIINRQSMNVTNQYRSEKMEIDVDNKMGLLTPGMYAQVMLQTKSSSDAFAVSKSAIVISTERKYVLVQRAGKIKKIDVVTGLETASRAEVYGDLQAGDKVILNANDEIKEDNGQALNN